MFLKGVMTLQVFGIISNFRVIKGIFFSFGSERECLIPREIVLFSRVSIFVVGIVETGDKNASCHGLDQPIKLANCEWQLSE